jgi:hypothetical protein
MHNLRKNFDRIFAIVKSLLKNKVDEYGNIKKVGPKAKFSDLEVITLSLLADSLLIDSENYLFKLLHSDHRNDFPNLIDRSNYNRRRRALTPLIEEVRQSLIQKLVPFEDTFVLDSMPLEICQFARAKRIKICHESPETAPAFGHCAVHNRTYYGYKIHGVCTLKGVITSFDLSPANVADIRYLQDIKYQYSHCLLLGDKGYLSETLQTELFERNRLLLKTPMRVNQTNYMRQPAVFRKVRKRIETVFSQLCDQFLIRRNYAKTFKGLATRILSKITAFTLLQYVNEFIMRRPLNHVKPLVSRLS